jgi:metal-responsive CopG/Arc/MetJ family transcriptional regulator
MGELGRGERLQIMLSDEELRALDDWRFKKRMPSRAAAVRELLRRGLAAEGFDTANRQVKSKDFGVIGERTHEAVRSPGSIPAKSNGNGRAAK